MEVVVIATPLSAILFGNAPGAKHSAIPFGNAPGKGLWMLCGR